MRQCGDHRGLTRQALQDPAPSLAAPRSATRPWAQACTSAGSLGSRAGPTHLPPDRAAAAGLLTPVSAAERGHSKLHGTPTAQTAPTSCFRMAQGSVPSASTSRKALPLRTAALPGWASADPAQGARPGVRELSARPGRVTPRRRARSASRTRATLLLFARGLRQPTRTRGPQGPPPCHRRPGAQGRVPQHPHFLPGAQAPAPAATPQQPRLRGPRPGPGLLAGPRARRAAPGPLRDPGRPATSWPRALPARPARAAPSGLTR